MARIVQAGWETGDVGYKGGVSTSGVGGTASVVSSTPTPPSPSAYCLKCVKAGGFNSGSVRVTFAHATVTELYAGFSYYRNNGTEDDVGFFWVTDSTLAVGAHLSVMANGAVRARVGTSGSGSDPNFTTLATSTAQVPPATWTEIEVHLIASTGSGGTLEVKMNGTTILNLTGVRTSYSAANFAAVGVGLYTFTSVASGPFNCIDNLRVNDTSSGTGSANNSWTGPEVITLMKPTSAGDSAQFARAGADSGANWSQCDDVPPNARTDYVSDSTVGHLDLYNTDAPTAAATVSAIDVIAQIFTDGAGGTLAVPIKTAAGQTDGPAYGLASGAAYVSRIYDGDPADSAAWTQTKLNALQVGFKVVS